MGTFLGFVVASALSAAPATFALNRLSAVPVVGQAVRLVYRLPSAVDGTVTFEPGSRIESGFAASVLVDDPQSFVVRVMDRNDQPQIVARELDRFGTTPLADGGWAYTVDESTLRTGFADLAVWRLESSPELPILPIRENTPNLGDEMRRYRCRSSRSGPAKHFRRSLRRCRRS